MKVRDDNFWKTGSVLLSKVLRKAPTTLRRPRAAIERGAEKIRVSAGHGPRAPESRGENSPFGPNSGESAAN